MQTPLDRKRYILVSSGTVNTAYLVHYFHLLTSSIQFALQVCPFHCWCGNKKGLYSRVKMSAFDIFVKKMQLLPLSIPLPWRAFCWRRWGKDFRCCLKPQLYLQSGNSVGTGWFNPKKVWVVKVLVLPCNIRIPSLVRSSAKPSSGSFVFGQNMGERVMVRVVKTELPHLSV